MKAVFVSYNQAHTFDVDKTLDKLGIRGFTRWALSEGRGSVDGEPHYGTHTWPSMNTSMLIFMDDAGVAPLLEELRKLDASAPQQGLRAFVMNAEAGM
jgi:hypothetical protein